MPSRLLSSSLGALLLIFGYLVWQVDEGYVIYTVPLILLLVFVYIMGPQIDWWWYKHYPPDVDKPVRKMLDKTNPFYQSLSEGNKTKFRQRLQLFVIGTNFIPKGWETIPEDVKYAIAVNAVQLNFNKDTFLFPPYENVVIYPTPFPSPQYPKRFHPSEVFKEDGVLLFSAEQIMLGLLKPIQCYNVAMHEYIKVYMDSNPTTPFPHFKEEDWPKMEQIGLFTRKYIEQLLNVPDISPTVVAITLFQIFPKRFSHIFPDAYQQLLDIFFIPEEEAIDIN